MTIDIYPAALQKTVEFFSHIDEVKTKDLSWLYHPQARFKDPFNEVQGLAAVEGIFQHMFVQVKQPRFVVTQTLLQDNKAMLIWDFFFYIPSFKKDEFKIHGSTLIEFSPDGLIENHRDYWDAAEELYEQLPVLGSLMRGLKKYVNRK